MCFQTCKLVLVAKRNNNNKVYLNCKNYLNYRFKQEIN